MFYQVSQKDAYWLIGALEQRRAQNERALRMKGLTAQEHDLLVHDLTMCLRMKDLFYDEGDDGLIII